MNYKKYNQTDAVQNENGEIIFPGASGWDKYQEWLKSGGVLQVEEEKRTPEQLQSLVTGAVQGRLDEFATSHGYDSIISLCTYSFDPDPKFAAEGVAGVKARSETWAALREFLGEVQTGQRPTPASVDEVLKVMPVLVWPGDEQASL